MISTPRSARLIRVFGCVDEDDADGKVIGLFALLSLGAFGVVRGRKRRARG